MNRMSPSHPGAIHEQQQPFIYSYPMGKINVLVVIFCFSCLAKLLVMDKLLFFVIIYYFSEGKISSKTSLALNYLMSVVSELFVRPNLGCQTVSQGLV